MRELFDNPAFLKMIYAVAFWVIFYVIVKILTVNAGIGTNLLSQCLKRLPKFKDNLKDLKTLSKRKSSDKGEKLMHCLKNIIRREKRMSKILDMYLFDDKNDQDVAAAKKLINAIPNICRNVVAHVADGDVSQIDPLFERIDENLKDAQAFIDKAISLDMKKKMLQL